MIEVRDLDYVINAHTDRARKPSDVTRKWDKKTPYHFHSIWCATMILHETSLPEETRLYGSCALLYHDIPEDTTAPFPNWLTDRVKLLVQGMTFSSSEDEWENLWTRDKEVRLLKVYDKTSNILDGVWMEPVRREKHLSHLKKLVEDVERSYEDLNILKLARTQY